MEHATADELLAGLDHIRSAPAERGTVELIVRRPGENERELLDEAVLDAEVGLVGDRWHLGASPVNDAQLTLMNARAAEAVARSRDRWPLAGDQLFVDFDLSVENVPAGTRVSIGEVVLELTEVPHTGCAKFSARFGTEALKFVNKSPGRELRLRGANARIVTPGTVRVGDAVTKLSAPS